MCIGSKPPKPPKIKTKPLPPVPTAPTPFSPMQNNNLTPRDVPVDPITGIPMKWAIDPNTGKSLVPVSNPNISTDGLAKNVKQSLRIARKIARLQRREARAEAQGNTAKANRIDAKLDGLDLQQEGLLTTIAQQQAVGSPEVDRQMAQFKDDAELYQRRISKFTSIADRLMAKIADPNTVKGLNTRQAQRRLNRLNAELASVQAKLDLSTVSESVTGAHPMQAIAEQIQQMQQANEQGGIQGTQMTQEEAERAAQLALRGLDTLRTH
jgi:hypothetical protein